MPSGLIDACPFSHTVNRGARVENIGPFERRHYLVVCRDCGATGPERDTFAGAIEAWNTRRKHDGDGSE